MDEQKALLQGLWRKAFSQDEPLAIPCKTASNATRMRFALYNAVRGVRTGKDKVDDLLRRATENCSISFDPEDKSILIMQKKIMTEMMQTVAEILGDTPELKKSDEQMEAEASLALLTKKLNEGVSPDQPTAADVGLPRVTPYYTR